MVRRNYDTQKMNHRLQEIMGKANDRLRRLWSSTICANLILFSDLHKTYNKIFTTHIEFFVVLLLFYHRIWNQPSPTRKLFFSVGNSSLFQSPFLKQTHINPHFSLDSLSLLHHYNVPFSTFTHNRAAMRGSNMFFCIQYECKFSHRNCTYLHRNSHLKERTFIT